MNYGNVYLIKKSNCNTYKIGVSLNVVKRLRDLQSANSDQLYIYNTVDCKIPFELEKKTHKKFKEFGLRGEWFSFENIEIVEYYMEITCKKINERMFICNSCNYMTQYTQHYEKHLKSRKHRINTNSVITQVEPEISLSIHRCNRCGKIFNRSFDLNRHLNRKKKCVMKLTTDIKNENQINIDMNIENLTQNVIDDDIKNKKTINIENIPEILTTDLENEIPINKKTQFCKCCKKTFSNKSNMIRHIKLYCRKKKENEEKIISLQKQIQELKNTLTI